MRKAPKLYRKLQTPADSFASRVPTKLSDVSRLELNLWSTHGPCIKGDDTVLSPEGKALFIIWPDWGTWARFYREIRDELHAERPWRREFSTAEKLLEAIDEGRDPVTVLDEIDAARAANDPRRALLGQVKG